METAPSFGTNVSCAIPRMRVKVFAMALMIFGVYLYTARIKPC